VAAARVFLVRHGDALPAYVDADRPLSEVGRDEAARTARWCAENGIAPHQIRHSGLLRAAQTAEILAARLDPPGGVRAVRGLAPDDDPRDWRDDLRHEEAPLMLVGHMPFVGVLAALLDGRPESIGFATAEVAVFDRAGDAFRLVLRRRPVEG
jgi:phosphohistidine phosphatase